MISGSVTHAADALSITQPAVSRLIADLEDSLGFALFERKRGQPLRPTEDAEILYVEVEKAFIGLDHLIKTGKDIHTSRGHLRVVGPTFLVNSLLSEAAAALLKESPNVSIIIDSRPHTEVVSLIASRQQDVAVAVLPVAHPAVNVIELGTFEAVCVVPESSKLAKMAGIKPTDLNGQSLITSSHGSQLQLMTDRLIEQHGVQVERRINVRTQESACILVSQGLGVAIIASPLPRHVISYPGLGIKRFTPALSIQLGVLLSNVKPPTRLMSRYIDALLHMGRNWQA